MNEYRNAAEEMLITKSGSEWDAVKTLRLHTGGWAIYRYIKFSCLFCFFNDFTTIKSIKVVSFQYLQYYFVNYFFQSMYFNGGYTSCFFILDIRNNLRS